MKLPSIFLLAGSLLFNSLHSGTVYMVHYAYNYTDSMLFNPNHHCGGLIFAALRHAIIQRGHNCTMLPDNCRITDPDAWFISLESQRDVKFNFMLMQPKDRCIMLMWEPPAVLADNYNPIYHVPYKAVFTLFHELVDYQKYFPLYYPQPFLYMIDDAVPFKRKKLCTMIIGEHTSSNPHELYTARRNIISFFEHNHPENFDFYGNYWTYHDHPCYKGVIKHKLQYLKQYKFAICYENMRTQTYITEKIFDILHTGCVPIYWGAEQIEQYIPYRCYILRQDFNSDEDLYQYLNSMSQDEYNSYLQAGKDFFDSPIASNYSISGFVNTILTKLFDE